MTNRPSKRTLVRWNDDHDKELLLWIVYCCNEQGMKIPFARVAQCMGASFTEGACIQHLAKIRNKMEEAGLHVPPTQKRGTVTRQGSSIYRPRTKEITGPVPRVRPELPPPTRNYGFYDDSDEEEESEEYPASQSTPPHRQTGRKTVRCQNQTLPNSPAVKHDSEEDEPVPSLYDSDNEYGAKKPITSPSLNLTPDTKNEKIQVKLTLGNSFAPPPTDQTASGDMSKTIQPISNTADPDYITPPVKFETLEDSMANYDISPTTTQPRATRRKSSAIAADDEDDEYEPESKPKSRTKKPRAPRATKKQKLNDKNKNYATQQALPPIDMGSFKDMGNLDADRRAMPPPSLRNMNINPTTHMSPDSPVGWNGRFMREPFTASSRHGPIFSGMNMNGSWSNLHAAPSQYDNCDYLPGSNMDQPVINALPSPSYDFSGSGMAQNSSAPATRTSSFASMGSNSTIESQPNAWSRPLRSPGFPNPREASKVLHNVINQSAADPFMSYHGFDDLEQANINATDRIVSDGVLVQDDGPHAAYNETHARWVVGADDATDHDVNFNGYFNPNEAAQYY